MLNVTKIELEIVSDVDMHLLFEKGMRGGAFYVSKRYNKANNKYLKSYDQNEKSKCYA